MNKLIICTVGTSISNGCKSQREILRQTTIWDDKFPDFQKEIINRINSFSEKDFRNISAEINSTDRIGISSADRIVLLCSDNAPGRICSTELKKVFLKFYNLNETNVEIKRIKDLQVRDAKKLREVGLKNFVKAVLEYLNNPQIQYSYETIINPTGGFKGVLPFLTVLGMLYGKRTVYIFEFADQLINLPPLPFSFDLEIFNRVKPALSLIDKEVAVSKESYLNKIISYTPAEHDLFMAFTEPFDNDLITISPFAFTLLNIENEAEQALVNKTIIDDLESKHNDRGVLAIKRLISNVSNPLWRNNHREKWHTTDLIIIKKPRTAERIAGFIEKEKFFVTHAFTDHNDYERILGKYSKKDFNTNDFVPWENNEDLGQDENNTEALVIERDNLLLEKKESSENIKKYKKQIEELNDVINSDNKLLNEKKEQLKLKDIKIDDMQNLLNAKVNKIQDLNQQIIQQSSGFFARIKRFFGGGK